MTARLINVDGPPVESILDSTYAIWNEGLTRSAYGRWYAAQRALPWGRERLRRVALVDADGRILSSAKCYRFDAVLDAAPVMVSGIGAVFTPPELRGRGHASALIEGLLDVERQAGSHLAALFSEIGGAYYQRFGFEPAPLREVTIEVTAKAGSPAMLVRAGDERDLPALAAMHTDRAATARLALRRGPPYIQFAISKRRVFTALSAPGQRGTGFYVAEEGHTAVAYLVYTESSGGWTFEEGGDRDPAGARLGAMLQVLIAREPSKPAPRIRAWWPAAMPVPPQLTLTEPSAAHDLLMVRPLQGSFAPLDGEDVFYWRSDVF